MSNIAIFDGATGEIEKRPQTAAEAQALAQAQAEAASGKEQEAAIYALQSSARRKIAEASGLTPEEMAALGF